MDDCRTPTLTAPGEFIFNVTPTLINNAATSYYQEVHSIMANMRSYTPIHTDVRSPAMSPIYKVAGSISSPVTSHHSSSFGQFKKPSLLARPVVTYCASPKYSDRNQYLSPCPAFGGSNSSFILSPIPSIKGECSGVSSQAGGDQGVNASMLNRTLTIPLLLRALGLECYCECFERAGIDCSNLRSIKLSDLKGIGIQSDNDCERIMEMFESFNSV